METGQTSESPVGGHSGVAGFILAGGMSSRMGRDKALLEVNGEILLLRLARILEELTQRVTVIGPVERYGNLGLAIVPDRVPGVGPLGGIDTALSLRQAPWNLILACDLPAVDATFLAGLLRRAEASHADCVIPRSNRPEPLCAVYSLRAGPPIQRALNAGVRKVTDALESITVDWYALGQSRLLTNLNTVRDLEAFLG